MSKGKKSIQGSPPIDAEALARRVLEQAMAERLNGHVTCPVHGPLVGLEVHIVDDSDSAAVTGDICCEQGQDALTKAAQS